MMATFDALLLHMSRGHWAGLLLIIICVLLSLLSGFACSSIALFAVDRGFCSSSTFLRVYESTTHPPDRRIVFTISLSSLNAEKEWSTLAE